MRIGDFSLAPVLAISFSQTDVFARDPQGPPPLFALPLFNLGKQFFNRVQKCDPKITV